MEPAACCVAMATYRPREAPEMENQESETNDEEWQSGCSRRKKREVFEKRL